MKVAVKASIFIIGIVLTIIIIMTLISNNTRADEMQETFTSAIRQSLEMTTKEEGYAIHSYEEFISDFHQALLLQVTSNSDIRIDVKAVDLDKGTIKMKITEKYHAPNGKEKEISFEKTVILEEYPQNHEKKYHTIIYKVDGTIYEKATAYTGSFLIMPKEPVLDGKTFGYWTLNGEKVEEMKITEDLTLNAVFL